MEYRLKLFSLRILPLILGLTAMTFTVACNSPYAGIGEKLDSSSWIDIEADGGIPFLRSFDGGKGIEILIMEGEVLTGNDFGSLSIIRVMDAELPVSSVPRLDIQVLQGSYTISLSNVTFDLNKMYSLSFKDTGGGIVTDSSQSESELDESLSYSGFIKDNSAGAKTVSFSDGTDSYIFQRMDITIDNIMRTDQNEMQKSVNIHKIYQISGIFAPQSRIPGFGGTDMLKYTTKTDFSSLMNTEDGSHYMALQLKQTLKATTTFYYNDACDLKPFRLNGEYVSVASMSGSGPLSGIVDFTMEGSSQLWNCSIDYNDIYVENTVAASGTYLLSIDGGEAQSIPFDNANPGILDFSTIPSIPMTP
ncbi:MULTISPECIES: hypothetical protein [unclassified Oceanispirochaeta]|uniref:hypothetical protein n=1 Tax=unclassified Oceanispirochaeta TaxID=2635722 RepID=UPI000E099BDB|nr:MULTISPECIES: hypothetical protein [unclassified Oceanispirochaeta]MBF9015889.1 hypothetical protein [Oceanispirochaeta sp. M2]NPD72352.1 hypothetical protein [Oceanispirochaeta sp. M1]RDG32123.1 hypothetical protein DV872_09595 [Oceanispirochaeta sp. M1]